MRDVENRELSSHNQMVTYLAAALPKARERTVSLGDSWCCDSRLARRSPLHEVAFDQFLVLTLIAGPAIRATDISYASVSKAISTSSACTTFKWEGSPNVKGGAIIMPVLINGTSISMQLDIGAETSQLYGTLAVR